MAEKIGLEALLLDEQFQAGVKRFMSGMEDMVGAQERVSEESKDVIKSTDKVGDSFGDAGIEALEFRAQMENLTSALEGVQDIIGGGLELAELGAQAERVERRFQLLGDSVGDADEFLVAFQEGAGGTVSEMEAMLSSSKLLQMGLVTTNDEMSSVVEMATRLGDQTASATARVEDFALMLANQSIPRLDNFGISSGRVRARMKELQAASEDMSRETAFMIATMDEGGESLGVLGERVDDSAAQFEKMEAKMADARVEMGKALAPIIGSIMGKFADMETATIGVILALGGIIAIAPKVISAIRAIQTVLKTGTLQMGLIGIAIIAAVAAIELYGSVMNKAAEEAAALEDTGKALETLVAEGAEVTKVVRLMRDAFEDLGVSAVLSGDGIFAQDERMIVALANAKRYAPVLKELHDSVLAGASSWEDYSIVIDRYNDRTKDSAQHIEKMGKAYVQALIFARDYNKVQKELVLETIDLVQAQEEQEAAFANSIPGMKNAWESMDKGEKVLTLYHNRVVMLTQAQLEGEDGFLEFSHATRQTSEDVDEARAAILGVTDALWGNEDALLASISATEDEGDAMSQAAIDALTQRDAIIALRDSQQAAALAAAEHEIALSGLHERLSATGPLAAAREGLKRLEKLLLSGAISEELYNQEVKETQLQYGLATERGFELTDGLIALESAVDAGVIRGEDFNEALDFLQRNADGSGESVAGMLDEFAQVPFVVSDVTGEVYAFITSGEDAQAMLDDLERELGDELPSAVNNAKLSLIGAGQALVDNLVAGISMNMWKVRDAVGNIIDTIMGFFHGSLPKEGELRRIGESGELLVADLVSGMTSQLSAVEEIGLEIGNTLASAIIAGTEGEESVAGGLLGAAGDISRAGGLFARLFKKRELDPLKAELKNVNDELKRQKKIREDIRKQLEGDDISAAQRAALENMIFSSKARTNELDWERIRLGVEYEKQQERILELQKQQGDLKLLEQQMALLELIKEHGLDPEDILGGLELGIDADLGELMDAMARAMQALIEAAEKELEIGSESKVFAAIGRETMRGMALGIEEMMGLPVRASLLAAQTVSSIPVSIAGTNITNNNQLTVQAGGNNISSEIDMARFESRVVRAVWHVMQGESVP